MGSVIHIRKDHRIGRTCKAILRHAMHFSFAFFRLFCNLFIPLTLPDMRANVLRTEAALTDRSSFLPTIRLRRDSWHFRVLKTGENVGVCLSDRKWNENTRLVLVKRLRSGYSTTHNRAEMRRHSSWQQSKDAT